MILVDTSVWVDYFNGVASRHTDLLDDALDDGTVAIGDLIFLELLQGFKSDKDYKAAKKALEAVDIFELLGSEMIEPCAANYRNLRKRGMTIRQTTDVIIASFCIKNKLPLLFQDRDFKPFVKELGLKSAIAET